VNSRAVLIARVDRELRAQGFRRRKSTWNRELGAFVSVIDIQTRTDGNAVTMNVGVLSRSVYFTCWGQEADSFIDEPFCTIRTRVGQLLDKRDLWWDLARADTADEMVYHLETSVLPFLDRMQSLNDMRDWLASRGMPSAREALGTICLAVVLSKLGDSISACAMLAQLERDAFGGWKARAKEVGTRIGCNSAVASM
jgi:Domain of unknown function (DUF4304)